MHSLMPTTTQPNWNYEGIILSYGSATVDLTDDMVVDFMDHRNDMRPSTRPSNVDENQVLRRMSTRVGQASACGTHHRFQRPGQKQN